LTLTFQFNDDYQLHGLGSSVNFLGKAQDGEYHKDIFKVRIIYSHIQFRNVIIVVSFLTFSKAACVLPSEHISRIGAAIVAAETNCAEAQMNIVS
jgi:hypothetical protein